MFMDYMGECVLTPSCTQSLEMLVQENLGPEGSFQPEGC